MSRVFILENILGVIFHGVCDYCDYMQFFTGYRRWGMSVANVRGGCPDPVQDSKSLHPAL